MDSRLFPERTFYDYTDIIRGLISNDIDNRSKKTLCYSQTHAKLRVKWTSQTINITNECSVRPSRRKPNSTKHGNAQTDQPWKPSMCQSTGSWRSRGVAKRMHIEWDNMHSGSNHGPREENNPHSCHFSVGNDYPREGNHHKAIVCGSNVSFSSTHKEEINRALTKDHRESYHVLISVVAMFTTRIIRFVSSTSKSLTEIVPCRLRKTCKRQTLENRAGFRLSRHCIKHTFIGWKN